MYYKDNFLSLKFIYFLFTAITTVIVALVLCKQLYDEQMLERAAQDSNHTLLSQGIEDLILRRQSNNELFKNKQDFRRSVDKLPGANLYGKPHDSEYLVLNTRGEVLYSHKTPSNDSLRKINSVAHNLPQKEGRFNTTLVVDGVHYRYYKKSSDDKYLVFLGTYNSFLSKKFWDEWSKRALPPFIIIAMFSIGGFIFSRKILNPISVLARNMNSLAKGEDMIHPIDVNAKEVADVSKALMSLERSMRKQHDIQESLSQKSQKLESILESNNEFISTLSHEIRTPIHGIMAVASGLLERWDEIDKSSAQKMLEVIAYNSTRVSSLVTSILDVAKAGRETLHLNLEDVSLKSLIEDMIKECTSLYLSDKNLSIIFDDRKDLVLNLDADKITQVLRNLLSNAIKVTKEGKIEISWDRNNDKVFIRIKDDGVGIPQKELDTIFELFNQSSRTKDSISGVGLGLAIARKIVHAHGGEIWAENNKDGNGASFIFSLPIVKSEAPKLNDAEVGIISHDTSPITIMLIDDEKSCILSAQMIAYSTNYNILGYENPLEAIDWLKHNHNKVDLIMVDMMLPEMSGEEIIKVLKSSDDLKNIPVIIHSGMSKNDKVDGAIEIGAVSFLSKPYNKEEFIKAVETAITISTH